MSSILLVVVVLFYLLYLQPAILCILYVRFNKKNMGDFDKYWYKTHSFIPINNIVSAYILLPLDLCEYHYMKFVNWLCGDWPYGQVWENGVTV